MTKENYLVISKFELLTLSTRKQLLIVMYMHFATTCKFLHRCGFAYLCIDYYHAYNTDGCLFHHKDDIGMIQTIKFISSIHFTPYYI
jgi:hypothetical protein